MRPQLGIFALIAFLATISAPLNFSSSFSTTQVLAQTSASALREAERLLEQGIQQIDNRQFDKAFQSLQQALTSYRELKDRQGEGTALANLANVYYSLQAYAKSIELHQQSLAIAREIADRTLEAKNLRHLGSAYSALGQHPQAIEYLQQSLAVAREIKNTKSEAAALGMLALAHQRVGDYQKAIDSWQQALPIFQQLKERRAEGAALTSIGSYYQLLENYPEARKFFQQGLVVAQELKDRSSQQIILALLGHVHESLAEYSQSIDKYQQSLVMAREMGESAIEVEILNNLAGIYANLSRYQEAIEYYQQSLTIAKKINARQSEAGILSNLGTVYKNLNDSPQAIRYYQQSLAITDEPNNQQSALEVREKRKLYAQTILNLGNIYQEMGTTEKAKEFYQESLKIAQEINDRDLQADILNFWGILSYQNLGDYRQASEYYQQSLALAKQNNNKRGEAKAIGNLGLVYDSMGDYNKAINYFQQDLALSRELKNKRGEAIALNNLGLTFMHSGKLTEAETYLKNGIEVLESVRAGLGRNDASKVSLFEDQANTYRNLQQVLIAQNKIEAALEISERGRARAFVELLASRLSESSVQPTLTSPNINKIKEIAKLQNSTLVEYSIVYEDQNAEGKKTQSQTSEIYIWVVKPTGEIAFRKVNLKALRQQKKSSLEELVVSSRESIGVRGRGLAVEAKVSGSQEKQGFKELHELLIKPISDLLPKDLNARIIFIPQSELFLVPFPALQDASGKYLIEQHTILTAPSIQVLDLTSQQQQLVGTRSSTSVQNQDVLIVGNPTMPSVPAKIGDPPTQLSSLPGAEREALAIAPLFKTKAFTGSQATKAAILQQIPTARIIHLATHGLLDDIRGLGSAIALAPSGNDNGLLTAEEILDLRFNAELVVLSACDTGRGRITGDGVIGLSRSLMSAGVPSVIVSLWQVPDAPTASLMTEFYQNLQKTPDKAAALRSAMLSTMKQHPDPKDWGAFTLIGEAE
ncbi:tetratricopeptide repeat protein [Coleofasciculus sp. FACHB-1120]|uniref:tetratricopeptide repeat protein n=1 Tax=Coleofasciculus sp. FACHB-1120 TaxID=2692783 RepID=UPI001688ED9E|nr:tetratricopeptide repeat protein [Coleofasciculus sp. FACHB-1120]MBD2743063.1 CHAT domain-containing protein [Coleofasciculus sp. FACHB-1120]